ncbi:2-dehydro-3-deoxyphosphooctonate aldolase (KDO 8-P synthase) [Catalinimonas alkaloidigena]|uniref:3-deoxy-8-phosphooctulonate synthase n=1 Tax=Catalinimonas alkaloidigena TaxID=1075417 RepID=A0A1G9UQS4_9BACT|nr:3-deoxy-8-phosphooctulonate synthase [Catalinimonas alkaloidigena]SDM62240.1 2-dehydro-3-deoxyphosphooctonate aldolase (KDO 8-P synthase) [Catalinimonas alkaloidigena]
MLHLSNLKHTDSGNFFLMAGPCVVESRDLVFEVAERLKTITDRLAIPWILKASYRKANRTRLDSFTGIGDETALEILREAGQYFEVPVVTDIHEASEAALAAPYVDVLQIPAFLCRQTELLLAAGATGKVVNVKKGQFVSGASMRFAVDKIRQTSEATVILTERGNSFGYSDLVVDFRNIVDMKEIGVPVVMDCTHSLQRPNQTSGVTGGQPDLIGTIAKAAIAVGADGLFIETHPRPGEALSDGANMLHLDRLEGLLLQLIRIRGAISHEVAH